MDKYEASVWRVALPTTANKGLVKRIRQGKATLADLAKGEAIQLGMTNDDYSPCADNGQNCGGDVYALSLPGVMPSARITWFQAQAACENSRKRLPSNAEWQAAVSGTPDPGPDNGTTDCNTDSTLAPVATALGRRWQRPVRLDALDRLSLRPLMNRQAAVSAACGERQYKAAAAADRDHVAGDGEREAERSVVRNKGRSSRGASVR
jgi:hypothetical protein